MNLDKRIRYYKAYLEDLIHTVKEDKGIKNIKDLERESFIQNIINAFFVRSSIEKYFKKTYLKEDLLLLELDKFIKDDEEIHNFFNELFKKYKKDCKGKNKLF